jgi:predicted lipid-binding transport protein (Tim44 family)
VREQREGQGSPFRELWLLARPKGQGPGWRIAGVQALG